MLCTCLKIIHVDALNKRNYSETVGSIIDLGSMYFDSVETTRVITEQFSLNVRFCSNSSLVDAEKNFMSWDLNLTSG